MSIVHLQKQNLADHVIIHGKVDSHAISEGNMQLVASSVDLLLN